MAEKNNKLQVSPEPKDPPAGEKKSNWFLRLLLNNKLVFFLILLIIAGAVYSFISIRLTERRAEGQRQELIRHYEEKTDSLYIAGLELTAKTFSWAVRSEMIRENMDQGDQFFSNLITQPEINKIKLINPANGEVLLSTDRKDRGRIIEEDPIIAAETTFVMSREQDRLIIAPVMGLAARIGVLVIIINPEVP